MQTANRIFRRFVKRICYASPRKVKAGTDACIYRPRRIDGPQFIQIGDRSTIDRNGWLSALAVYRGIHYKPEITIGSDVHIGRYSCLTSISSIVIEDGCLISEYAYISDHGHGLDPDKGMPVDQPLVSKGSVRIGANSFIGYRACVLSGVVLGRHCVVGAGAVVTHSFPDFSVIAGCPARLIGTNSAATNNSAPVKAALGD